MTPGDSLERPDHHSANLQEGSRRFPASPIDDFAAGIVRTLEEIQRDPLLHHRLSQRGF